MPNGQILGAIALGVIVLVLGAFIVRDVILPPSTTLSGLRTANVTRTTITSTVTGTGNVEPITQVNVNFKTAGTLTEVDVKPGDKVTQGQVLAKIDPTSLQSALNQAQHNLNTAGTSYNDTVASVSSTNQSDASAVSTDQSAIAADNSAIANDKAASAYTIQYPYDNGRLQSDTTALQTAEARYTNPPPQGDGCFQNPQPNPAQCTSDQQAIGQDKTAVGSDQQAVNGDLAALNADTTKLNADTTRLSTDTAKQSADQVSGQQRIDQALSSLTSAQDGVNTPQQNLGEATLSSPISGVVLTVNGTVGESVAAGTTGSGSQLAPGTTAPLPSSSSGSGSGSGSSPFIVLVDPATWVAVAPFAETDAASIQPGQPAQVTFDALTGVALNGSVLAVSGTSTTVSNVVNYYVTVSLTEANSALKTGMTANVVVTTQAASNVVAVPNTALHVRTGQTYVTVLTGGHQSEVPVATGLADSRDTEIQSGLQPGDVVVLPSLNTTSSGSTNLRGTGLGGLGGGGTFGGGGGGGGGFVVRGGGG